MPSFFASKPAAPAPLALTRDQGAVLLVAVANVLLCNLYMSIRVGQARRKHGVAYPSMVGPHDFLCTVRAHLNTLENQPAELVMLLLTALVTANGAAISGAVWVVGRVLYFEGYASGDPKARMRGAFNSFALLWQLYTVARAGVAAVRGA
jgi:glutathione S-transferase